MRIYFSGIGGVGIGPLALIAKDMGHTIIGSDLNDSRYTKLMQERGVSVMLGQDGSQIEQAHTESNIDWLVYTSALPPDHPEITFAREHGIRLSKRDELLNELITDKGLKMVAVAGTHGKTTTTAMLIWLFKQAEVPVSYSVGTDISFGPSGQYEADSEYFIYEADEYDRNFLQFQPYTAILPSVDYDHQDIYPTKTDYLNAFKQFVAASHCTYLWSSTAEELDLGDNACLHAFKPDEKLDGIKLAGQQNRRNAFLAIKAARPIIGGKNEQELAVILADFPGVGRRFEALAPNIYSDYAHHPVEITATIEQALELNKRVAVVYQPHQNSRQHRLKDLYRDAFNGASAVYWLPTYLSREDTKLSTLTPDELIAGLINRDIAQPADMDDDLKQTITKLAADGTLVLLMSAGSLDEWARQQLAV